MSTPKSWNDGEEAIVYSTCGACRHVWYFRRAFCPSCGVSGAETHRSAGRGVVYAATVVLRAATPETKQFAPYAILLIDMDEGFRMMAHGDNDLGIGDKVVARFRPFVNGVLSPYFDKA